MNLWLRNTDATIWIIWCSKYRPQVSLYIWQSLWFMFSSCCSTRIFFSWPPCFYPLPVWHFRKTWHLFGNQVQSLMKFHSSIHSGNSVSSTAREVMQRFAQRHLNRVNEQWITKAEHGFHTLHASLPLHYEMSSWITCVHDPIHTDCGPFLSVQISYISLYFGQARNQ